ncbi:54S ribosomal protein L39 [Trichoderma ghanense]|uniref:Large ribosomal subunit protein bL33m n=1 Tax=Trichoderma ghanense TaxID=65468 RepID=A0ABY2HH50_9HYPO
MVKKKDKRHLVVRPEGKKPWHKADGNFLPSPASEDEPLEELLAAVSGKDSGAQVSRYRRGSRLTLNTSWGGPTNCLKPTRKSDFGATFTRKSIPSSVARNLRLPSPIDRTTSVLRARDNVDTMAKKAKARLINVRLISMAMTGFFYTFKRPRTAPMMGMLKYDPIVRKKVLFLETKKRSK